MFDIVEEELLNNDSKGDTEYEPSGVGSIVRQDVDSDNEDDESVEYSGEKSDSEDDEGVEGGEPKVEQNEEDDNSEPEVALCDKYSSANESDIEHP